jgi:hypothetical protein
VTPDLPPPIVVVGASRSGTSMTALLLEAHGVFIGRSRAPSPKNPRGFGENPDLFKLAKSPCDAACLTRRARATLLRHGWSGGPWLVKHGVQFWRSWLPLSPRYVCVRRDVGRTVESQLRWQPATKDREQRRALVTADHQRLDEVRDAHGGIDFWPGEAVGDVDRARQFIERLGLDFDPEAARLVIDPSLWDRP